MAFEKLVLDNLKKYKVLAIVGVFLSFFVIVGILNYFQRVTLEGFVSLQQTETFANLKQKKATTTPNKNKK